MFLGRSNMNALDRFDSFPAPVRIVAIVLAAFAASPAMASGDFIFGDDFESSFVCPAGPTPAITGAISPASISTSLGTQNRYLVKVYSCGYSGTVTLTPNGAPASWTLAVDPPSKSLALNGVAVAQLTVTVPTDGDAGLHAVTVDAAASGANTVPLNANLDVAKEYAIHFAPDGTGVGMHAFLPALLTVKVGTKLRFISDDSTATHNIHAANGLPHQSVGTYLTQGQEYDIIPASPVESAQVNCHSHVVLSEMHITVVP
jgi:plastocyanin